ncbi:hypothetical protein A3B51_02110 [Candidatus Curtissbacteria bacterium RIFCSPLOWO2_01_FULL_41_18]|uniref:Uncharacterized protein n=2 Tax=Candidatus Curtissiibacteriota TaxID=1752717 RepID=A0A1F5G0T1_9BACT|nr:MAG: hypothetical protein A2696_02480 [Candidatus Curtissbacteria bacterium RIFCSPHIGHO2_01_FULL_41_13]OGE05146.1 MAG: hypothetical protein A3B51_02110 [Candidatus Curtissbacteria bacterium RIFCSPLOWO2_01_FULL_41_18]
MNAEQLGERSAQKETHARLIVEIGPGHNLISSFSDSIVGSDDMYICIERSPFILKSPQIKGDFAHLPLKDESADQIWVMNVFGEHYAAFPAVYDPLYSHFQKRLILPGSTAVFFLEMARVLKPSGRVFIGETYTPPPLLPEIDFTPYGLSKEVLNGDLYDRFVEEHKLGKINDTMVHFSGKNAYFLILTKEMSSASARIVNS